MRHTLVEIEQDALDQEDLKMTVFGYLGEDELDNNVYFSVALPKEMWREFRDKIVLLLAPKVEVCVVKTDGPYPYIVNPDLPGCEPRAYEPCECGSKDCPNCIADFYF